MLSRANRITRGSEFRMTVRSGRRSGTAHAVVYLATQADPGPTRFGFIVSKAVGNSVVRHRVTRRLRAIGHELLPSVSHGSDVIIRALPGSDEVAWATLHGEIHEAISRSETRR